MKIHLQEFLNLERRNNMGKIDSLYVADKTKGACYNETTKKAFCQVECAHTIIDTQATICGHDFGLVEFF